MKHFPISMTVVLVMRVLSCSSVSGQTPSGTSLPPTPVATAYADGELPQPISPTTSNVQNSLVPPTLNPVAGASPAYNLAPVQVVTQKYQPGWYVQGETMFLQLSHGKNQFLAYDVIQTSPSTTSIFGPVQSTNDIVSKSFGAMPRGTLGYQFDDGVRIEATYFGRNDWSGSAGIAASPSSTPSVIAIEMPDTYTAQRVSTSLSSTLNSVELSLFQSLNQNMGIDVNDDLRVDFLGGIRYFQLNEQFRLHASSLLNNNLYQSNYNAQTANNLYGAQIGLRLERKWKRWSLAGTGKAGLFANDASQQQFHDYATNQYEVPARDIASSKLTAAMIEELRLDATFQVTKACTIRGGYNVFVIHGLARVGDQLDFSATPGGALSTHGNAVLYGPSAGIEFRF